MIRSILYFSLGFILLSCNKDAKKEIVGTWQLTEVYSDPGDGSGDFQSVNSDKTIEFRKNGTVRSNGNLCNLSIETGSPTEGTYSHADKTISSNNCTNSGFEITYKLVSSELIISYPCFEACQAKYEKIN